MKLSCCRFLSELKPVISQIYLTHSFDPSRLICLFMGPRLSFKIGVGWILFWCREPWGLLECCVHSYLSLSKQCVASACVLDFDLKLRALLHMCAGLHLMGILCRCIIKLHCNYSVWDSKGQIIKETFKMLTEQQKPCIYLMVRDLFLFNMLVMLVKIHYPIHS